MGIIQNKQGRQSEGDTYNISEDLWTSVPKGNVFSVGNRDVNFIIHQNVAVHRILDFEASGAIFYLIPNLDSTKAEIRNEPGMTQPEADQGEKQNVKITVRKNSPARWVYLALLVFVIVLVLIFAWMR